jgi:hypothetical protein
MQQQYGFISYAREHRRAFEQLKEQLDLIERTTGFTFWSDSSIDPGENFDREIKAGIGRASCFILMVSVPFFNSEYILETELPEIWQRHQAARGSVLLVVPVDDVPWGAFLDERIQAVPTDPRQGLVPLLDWKPQRKGFGLAREQIEMKLRKAFGLAPKGPRFTLPNGS